MLGEKYSKINRNKETLKFIFRNGFNITLILLALNLISINLTIFDSSFMLISTGYVLLSLIIFNLPFKKLYNIISRKNKEKKSLYKITAGLILILFSLILLLVTKLQMLWLTSIPILLSGLDLTLREVKIDRNELHLLSISSFVYAIFYILVQTIPILWYSIQQLSLLFSSGIGSAVGKNLLLGPSTSGLWIVIIFFIFSCCVLFLSNRKKIYFLINVIGLTSCWIFYLIILSFVDFESKSNILNLQYILFLICFLIVFIYFSKTKLKIESFEFKYDNIKLKKVIKNRAVWVLFLIFLFGIIITVFSSANSNTNEVKKNILFYGQNMLGSWDVPEYGKYGKTASGMFGLLPHYLNNSGYDSEIVVNDKKEFLNITLPQQYENITRYTNLTDYSKIIESKTITKDILDGIDIFVVINLNKLFSEVEYTIIWDFVENGGSLLVLGDHTDIDGIMNPLNSLLKPVGIQFRFDDALPIDSNFKWIPCYQLMYNPITYKINNLDEIGISVGASLDVNFNSFPIIVGRYGLSDKGNRLNTEGAFLGDYEYNKGEQIGDIILVAGAYYGTGKVLVFGDTSPFQNMVITKSFPFLSSVFNWLASEETSTIKLIQIGAALSLLLILFTLYLTIRNNKIHFVLFPIILCLAIVISTLINPIILGEEKIKDNLIYIDTSHIERINLELYENESLSGLMLNFMRNNYLPLFIGEFSKDKVENSNIIVFNAPTKSFNTDEVDFLKHYIFNGGLVIISTGYSDKDASMPLLREFKLDLYDIPLGPVPYVEENPEEFQKEPRFVNSWPIKILNNNKTDLFYSIEILDEEYTLITFTHYGDGGLILISDGEFLYDTNIESINDYWPGNIQFLYNIIDKITIGGK